MGYVDSFEAGLRVEAAVADHRRWSIDLRVRGESALEESPLHLHREISTRAMFEQVVALPEGSPAKQELRAWVAALTIERVTHDDRVEFERAMRVERHKIAALGDRVWSLRTLSLEASLTEVEPRREAIASGLAAVVGEASSLATWWLGRRHAAAVELGLSGLREVEAPLAADLTVDRLVEIVLSGTDALAEETLAGGSSWTDTLVRGAALDALEGWPARLTTRWLWSLFGHGPLADGMRIELAPLGTPLCGASFLRALDAFGGALHSGAAALGGVPFLLRERPYDAARASYGTLFASLLASVPFTRKRLGLGPDKAKEQARVMALAMLVHTRATAVRASVACCASEECARNAHARVGTRALCATLPDELLGVVPRYDPRAVSKLAGIVVGARLREALEERYDEDWFDNPRALAFLREIDCMTRVVLDEEALRVGAKAAWRFFEAAIT